MKEFKKSVLLAFLLVNFEQNQCCMIPCRAPISPISVAMRSRVAGLSKEDYVTSLLLQKNQAIFDKVGVRHINHVECSDPAIIPITQQYSKEIGGFIKNDEARLINAGFFTLDALQRMHNRFLNAPDLSLRKDLKIALIPGKGYGVVATKDIAPQSSIGIYAGELVHGSQVQDQTYVFNSLYAYHDGTNRLVVAEMQIDGKKAGNYTRFINDPGLTKKSNCYVLSMMDSNNKPQLIFFTNQLVKAGEELTFDYGSLYPWTEKRV